MRIYLISENNFLFEGIKRIIEDEYGIPVMLTNNNALMIQCRSGFIKKSDIFLVTTDSAYTTLSTLVLLEGFACDFFLLGYNSHNTTRDDHNLPLFTPEKLDINYIKKILKGYVTPNPDRRLNITKKEAVVFSYILQDHCISSISKKLNISKKTVYNHQRNISIKLGVKRISHVFLS